MPLLKSPTSLLELSAQNVAQSMDSLWCKYYQESLKANNPGRFRYIDGPFNLLCSKCVKLLLKKLPLYRKVTKTHLDLLIVPYLKEIDFSGWAAAVNDETIELIRSRCKGLTKIQLDQCDRVSSTTLFKLIETFYNTLLYISISHLKISPGLLKFIGSRCVNLRVLRIDMCKVKRSDIEAFFFSDKSRCLISPAVKSLEALHMNGCSFPGDVEVIAKILKHCPHIKCISHFSIWDGIAKLCHGYTDRPRLQFQGHKSDLPLSLCFFQEKSDILPCLPNCVPHLTHLCISDVHGMNIPLVQLITGFSVQLKSLTLEWIYPYHLVRYIGACCVNLKSLSLHVIEMPISGTDIYHGMKITFEEHLSLASGVQISDVVPWSKLENISICFPNNPPTMPTRFTLILYEILEQAKNTLTSINLTLMTDSDIDSILIRALNSKCLQNLELLNVSRVRCINFDTIWEILLCAPVIKELSISDCPLLHVRNRVNVIKLIKENNYDVKVDWT